MWLVDSLIDCSKTIGFLADVMVSYSINQGILWWLFNICAIFWKVQFPFHSRYYDRTNKTKHVHIACVISALAVPIIAPAAISLRGGFTFSRFPPVVCVAKGVDANFYTVVLPTTLICAVGTTLLLIIFWNIRRVRHLFE